MKDVNSKVIYALGVGASTPVFCEIATACGYYVAGLYHYNNDRTGDVVNGMEIKGSFDDLFSQDIKGKQFLLTMGDVQIRKELTDRIENAGGILPTLIHPMTSVSPNAQIDKSGVLIRPMTVIQTDAQIGKGVVLRDMALVCHNAVVGEYTFVGPKALVGAFVDVQGVAFIGQGSILVSKKAEQVGRNTTVGAGSVVVKLLPENVVAVGNPAKVIKTKE